MRLTPYQIIAPLVALVAILYAWNLVMRQKKTLWEACFWTIFWGAIALIALYPSILSYLSAITGIVNQENAVLVTFMGILFFMVFYLVVRIEELEQRHTKVVRALALREAGLQRAKRDGDGEEDRLAA
jgi:hypothetical protein